MSLELSEQEQFRRQSLDELRNLGIDPYPAALYPTNAFSTDIKAEFKDDESGKPVCIAGRIMSRRIMGNVITSYSIHYTKLYENSGCSCVTVTCCHIHNISMFVNPTQ